LVARARAPAPPRTAAPAAPHSRSAGKRGNMFENQVREWDGAMYKKILVPIDLADPDLAKPAVATALMMAGPSGGMIRFVNVLPLTPVMLAEYVPPDFEVQHLFPRLQRRPRGALRQVLGAGGTKLKGRCGGKATPAGGSAHSNRFNAALAGPFFRRPGSTRWIDRAHEADGNTIGVFDNRVTRPPKCVERWLKRPVTSACQLVNALVHRLSRSETEAQDDAAGEIGATGPARVPDRREMRAVEFQLSAGFGFAAGTEEFAGWIFERPGKRRA